MADQTVTIRANVQTTGLDNAVNSSSQVHENLSASARAAQQLERSANNAGDALRRAAAAGGGSKTGRAAMAGSRTPQENLEYGQMRGSAGATGAAARDFAEQSRGLGGLVRLYATFAANIFAVSAAFNVLKNAADTTNLIAGLNTLGAVSGKSLGTVAKQLSEASDGAVSLREAMSSVAMTSSAGMTNQNILRLGAVAKTASLALGVSMPDALNRLSRGIVKLEPELLDELGIFTKIEPATQAYALQLGKTTSQLTDFERRQAFANAVLKEGEDKFAALADQKANPYDKLLASLKNVAFSGLELLNMVLKPIVEILASSPTALALGIAAVIAAIVRRAIPAVADLRAAFGEKLEDGIKRTQDKIEGLKASYKALADYSIKQAGYAEDAKMAKLEQSEKKILDFYERTSASRFAMKQGKMVAGQTPEFGQIIQENPLQLTQDNLQQLKAAHADYVSKVSAGNIKITEEVKQRIAFEKEFIVDLGKVLAGEKDFSSVREKALAQAQKDLDNSKLAKEFILDEQKLRAKGRKDEIVSAAVARSNTLGIGIAWKLLKIDIEAASTSVKEFNANLALAQGALGIAGGKLLSLFNKVSGALTAISIGAAVFALLEGIFSKNEKQIQAFKGSVDAANDSVDNTKRTLAELDRAGLGKSLTDTAISLSNAFSEISSSAQKLVIDARLAKEASTGWLDTVVEGFKDLFGYGIDDQVAKGLSKQLISALDILRRSGIDDKYRERFKELLQVKDLSASTVEKALSTLGEDVRNRFTALLESARKELDKTRSDLESFKDASDKAVKSYQEFLQSTANTNPLFKLGEGMEILADSMINAMRRGTVGIQSAFEELNKDPKKVALFGKEFVQDFVAVQEGFMEQSNAVREYTRLQAQLQSELESVQIEEQKILKAREDARKQGKVGLIDKFFGSGAYQGQESLGKSAELRNQIKAIQEATLKIPTDQIEKGRELFAKGLDIAFERGATYIKTALGQAAEKAGITIAKANATVLSGERAAEESTRIRLQEIDIQITAVKVNLDLIRENELLQAEMAALRASVDYARVSADQNATAEEKRAAYESKVATGLVASILSGRITQKEATQQAGAYSKSDEILNVPVGVDSTMIMRQVNAAVGSVRRKEGEQQAKLTELGGERRAAQIEGGLQRERQRLEDRNKLLRIENDTNQIIATRSGLLQSIAGLTTEQVIIADAQAERQAMINRQNIELSSIELARNQADAKFDETKQIKFQQEAAYQQKLLDANRGKNAEELKNLDIRTKQRKLDLKIQDIQKQAELEKSARDTINAAEEAKLEIQRAQFTSAAELYDIDKQLVVSKTAQLDVERANFDAIKQRGEIEANLGVKRLETEARVKSLGLEGIDLTNKLAEEQKRLTDITNNQLEALENERNKRLEILEIQKQQALKQAEMAYETDQAARYAEALKGAFGSTGSEFGALAEKLGNFSKSLIENNQQQIKDQGAIKEAVKAREAAEAAAADYSMRTGVENAALEEKLADAKAAEDRTRKKARDNELAGNAKSLAMAKTMFKEHTAAYKILAALERVQHIQRMVNMGIEFATKIGNLTAGLAAKTVTETTETGLTAGGFMARAGYYITEIFAKITSQLGVFGPPIAAGIIAAIGLAAFGGGKGGAKGGAQATGGAGGGYAASAEQQQKVQGTAFALDSQGKEVQVRRGVFGAEDEKSDAIRKSIDVIKETSVDGLAYYNGMLEALQSIDSAIGSAAKGLYGVQGLRTGSMFGTQEGTSGRSGFLGIGSKSITTEIKDSGLLIQGTFKDLAAKTNQGVLELYETVATTVKRGGFLGIGGGTSTSYSTKYSEVSQNISEFFSNVFTGGFELFKQVGKKAGYTEAFVEGIVGAVDVGNLATSLRGLKGEEFDRELQAVISTAFSMASEQLFPQFIQFAKFGEDLTQTVIRVVDANEKVNQQLKNIGGSGGKDFFASEKLVDLFGGLSEFISKTNDFRDKFLTDAQRLAPVTQAVTSEFDRLNQLYGLGLSTSMTREQFASITAGSEGNETLYASLIKVSGGFDQVLTSLEAAAEKAEKAREKIDQLTESVFDYRNATTQLEKDLRKIRKTHTETIKELEELGQATQDNITLLAEYTKFQLLERIEQDIQKLYETRRSELDKTIDTLTQAKTRILDLRDSLLRGPQSTLTPVQKNVNLRTAYGTLLAQTTSALPEERELGRSKIVDIAQQYLQSSQEIYRSSQMYTMIYNQIISDLNTIYGDIEGELQNAKTDRRLLEESVNFLGLIKTNTENTAQKLTQLLNLYSTTNTSPGLTTTVQARATGGLASGVTLVGERGPELVDFRDPGRVYSANQTRGMFGLEQTAQYNQQMLAELRTLNEKIDCLEQVVAEGAVLNANATNKNTQQIVGAVVVNTSQTVESTRLQSRIVIK